MCISAARASEFIPHGLFFLSLSMRVCLRVCRVGCVCVFLCVLCACLAVLCLEYVILLCDVTIDVDKKEEPRRHAMFFRRRDAQIIFPPQFCNAVF